MKVFLSELAEFKLLRLSEYLVEKWNLKTRDIFLQKLTKKIKQISSQPDSCPKSNEFDGLFKCVVTKQLLFIIGYYLNQMRLKLLRYLIHDRILIS